MFLVRGSFLIAWRTTGKRTSHSTIKPVSSTISSNSPTRPESYPRCPCTRYSTNVHDRIRVTTVQYSSLPLARGRDLIRPRRVASVVAVVRAVGRRDNASLFPCCSPSKMLLLRTQRAHAQAAMGLRSMSTRSMAGPSLKDFIPQSLSASAPEDVLPPYLSSAHLDGNGRGVYVETYGCQMNVADTEVVHAVLKGSNYTHAHSIDEADVVLLNTCAIRENAEEKIWARLRNIRAEKRKAAQGWRKRGEPTQPRGPIVGLLGCMGERLKGKLLEEEKLVDIVCGPDAYRSLPRLLAQARTGEQALDVALSLDETYADVAPVREGSDGVSAFVSIMRGCNNMCSYCIVPHTRGRERSRPVASIAREVAQLAAEGYREVTLLGQNVNSYADSSETDNLAPAPPMRDGFKPMVPPPKASTRFAGLLEQLASEVRNLRPCCTRRARRFLCLCITCARPYGVRSGLTVSCSSRSSRSSRSLPYCLLAAAPRRVSSASGDALSLHLAPSKGLSGRAPQRDPQPAECVRLAPYPGAERLHLRALCDAPRLLP